MARFIVEGARLSCQYGRTGGMAEDMEDRHVTAGESGRQMASDFDLLSKDACFYDCHSPYHPGKDPRALRATGICNVQQAVVMDEAYPCCYKAAFGWQGTDLHVRIAGGNALLEDAWTICGTGLGIVSFVSPGQEGCSTAQEIQEKLDGLDKVVAQYMEENGIKASRRELLMESILLWNGYQQIVWETESSEDTRAFCAYMQENEPVLFNYFERGLYIGGQGEEVDLTYMLGMYKATQKAVFVEDCITEEMVYDDGLMRGYLEAVRMEPGKSIGEALSDYLAYHSSPDYDSRRCYQDFAMRTPEETRQYFCRDHPEETDGKSDLEVDLILLERTLEQEYGMGEVADLFMDRLRRGLDG